MSLTPLPLRTRLCDLLAIRYPVIQAPMAGGWTTPELVSEVSNAGGLRMLAGARVSLERMRKDILAVRARTARPFGVNFLLAPPEAGNKDTVSVQHFLDRFREELGLSSGETDLALPPSSLSKQLEIVFKERVPVLGVALGEPGDLVEQAHAKGMLVTSMVTSVEEAVLVAEVERTS